MNKLVNMKSKQQNVIKLRQLCLQQKFISLVNLMNNLIIVHANNEEKLDLFI